MEKSRSCEGDRYFAGVVKEGQHIVAAVLGRLVDLHILWLAGHSLQFRLIRLTGESN